MGQKTKKWAVLTAAVVLGLGVMTPQMTWASTALSGDGANTNSAVAIQEGTTAVGDKAKAQYKYSTAIGSGATTDENVQYGTAVGYNASATGNFSLAVGAKAGADLYAVAMGYEASGGHNSVAIGASAKTGAYSIAIGWEAEATQTGVDGGEIAIGLKAKATAEEAMAIGDFATASKRYALALGYSANAGEEYSIAIGRMANASSENAIAIGKGSGASASNSMAIGLSAIASSSSSLAVGSRAISSGAVSTAIGTGAEAKASYSTAIGAEAFVSADKGVVTENGNEITTVSFGHQSGEFYGSSSYKYTTTRLGRLTNVAEGKADTDAVNVAQLKSYVESQIGSGTGTGTVSASDLAGNGLVATSDNKLAIDTSGGAITENNTGFVTGGTIWKYIQDNAGSGSSAAIGDTTKLSGAGLGDNVTDSILSVNDKLTKEGSYAAANGKVEIKNNAGDVAFTITGLNTDATDLGDTQKLVDAGLGKTVTDSILSVNDKVGSLSDDINKVGAGAAALAALRPEGFDPDDKWSFAVGYGHYKNANAGALGAFFKPNADTTVSFGGTIGNGDPMMNAGVSFKLGNRGKKAGTYRNVRDVVARVDRLEEFSMQQSARIDAQNRIISLQTERIQKLEAQVAMLMQHAGLTDSVQKTVTR